MKAFIFCIAFLFSFGLCSQAAKAQVKRKVAESPPLPTIPPPPPPPPGPPPDFIDDETEFDDGDDLPDDYPPPQRPMNGQQLPSQPPPFPQAGQPFPPPAAVPPPPPPPRPTVYENDRPTLQGSRIHFKVLKDEFAEKGEKRERGHMDQ